MSARRAQHGPTLPGFATEGEAAHPEPDRAERAPCAEEQQKLAHEEPEFVKRIEDESRTPSASRDHERQPALPSRLPDDVVQPVREGDRGAATETMEAGRMVALSDGSQDVTGTALLAGLPLPPGYRLADFGPGIAQGPIAACEECGRGTIVYLDGRPRHRGCPTQADIEHAANARGRK